MTSGTGHLAAELAEYEMYLKLIQYPMDTPRVRLNFRGVNMTFYTDIDNQVDKELLYRIVNLTNTPTFQNVLS
jgi:hypothetical protein